MHMRRTNVRRSSYGGYETKKDFRAPSLPLELDGCPVVSDKVDVPAVGQHNHEILQALDQEAVDGHG